MTLERRITVRDAQFDPAEEKRITHQLDVLERRLPHEPEPLADLVVAFNTGQRRFTADLRLQLNPLGTQLVSHQSAETADRAVRLAVDDLKRQLERHHAQQRGESSYGVPSRRLPRSLRPNPLPGKASKGAPETEEEGNG